MDRLYDKLVQYSREDYYPMHMPGHKRNTKMLSMVDPYAIDITEIDGFDNLHQAEGMISQLSVRLKNLYGAGRSYPLINGSTAGILAGISAATDLRDHVLIARNCHRSVYHALALRELKAEYLYPDRIPGSPVNGGILPAQVEEQLAGKPGLKLVIITSPTYEGIVSDIRAIAGIVHRHGALLLVDEAHGAHFGFHKGFPESAVISGADIVIQSLHKTLPAFTQTAVLHSNRPDLDRRIEQYLAIYQSSSPSYLLMAGMDRCVCLLEEQSGLLFDAFFEKLQDFYRTMKQLKYLQLVDQSLKGKAGVYDMDPSKLTILTGNGGLTGHAVSCELREKYHIVMEMASLSYVLGMTSIADTAEGFQRLMSALLAIDEGQTGKQKGYQAGMQVIPGAYSDDTVRPMQAMAISEAMGEKTRIIKLSGSHSRISASFVSLYPPGIPLIVPGEIIPASFAGFVDVAMREGLNVTGLTGDKKDEIEVILKD